MNRMSRRSLLGAGLGTSINPAAFAQQGVNWPSRPIRLIVPYAAGGPSDVLARAIQVPLQASLGQSVVVDNRPGGGAIIGTEAAARADDGYSFLVADSPHTIIPAVQPRVPYDPVNDFVPVTLFGAVSMLLAVNPGFPAQTLPDFLAAARAKEGAITFGSSGVGSLTHLLPEWLGLLTRTSFTTVPYRGSGPALLDVVGGQLNAIFTSTLSAAGPLRDAQVRPLAVASVARTSALPEVMTFREESIDMISSNWWGVLAPRSTPAPIVGRLNEALGAAMDDTAVKTRFETLGIEARPRGPGPFAELLKAEFENWARVARDAGVKVQ
ncbi:Bug family tripartite tricarboxylate transporter substrate binding protein [Roseomonas sp. WA12]